MATQKDFKVKNGLIVGGGDVSVDQGSISISDQISGDTGQITISNGQLGDSFMRIGIIGGGTANSHIRTDSNLDFHIGQSATSTTPSVSIDTSGNIQVSGDLRFSGTARIRADSAINFLTISGAAQLGKFKSVAAQISYTNGASDGMFNALNGYAVGTGTGTTVIDSNRDAVGFNSVALDDNKKLYLGTGDDVEFFFDGSQAILRSPDAHLCGTSGVRLASGFGVGQQTYLDADYDNGVRLYHEGALKAQTQDDGFKVTGEIKGTQFAYSYYNSTSTTLTTSYAVVNLDTLQASTGISGISIASNVVTISRSGTFMITLDIVTDVTSGGARSESEAQLYKNGSAVTGTFVGMYNRTANRGLATGSATTMISVTSGDTFEIRAKKTGTDTVVTSVGGTRLTFLQVA